MVRAVLATVILAVLVAGAFAGIFGGSSSSQDDQQINREHKRLENTKIRQCNCEQQQRKFFNLLKQVHQQCYQQCTDLRQQQEAMPEETRDTLQTVRECTQEGQRLAQDALECIDKKLQEQKSCTQQDQSQSQQQEEVDNRDSAVILADHYERMINNVRQPIEEAYEQQKNTDGQRFGKAVAHQVIDCTGKCFTQKVRQMDNSQRNSCEFRLNTENLKSAIGECKQKHYTEAVDKLCQCATQKSKREQHGAQEFCQLVKEKKFDAEQLFKQY